MSNGAQENCCGFRGKSATAWDIIQSGVTIGEITAIASGGFIANLINRGSYSGSGNVLLSDFLEEVAMFVTDPDFMG
jgi:hypothetical protein